MQALQATFPDVRVGADPTRSFRFDLSSFASSDLVFLEYRFAGADIWATAESPGYIVGHVRIDGEMTHGRNVVDTRRPFFFPRTLDANVTRSFTRLFDIPTAAVARYIDQLGDPAVNALRIRHTAPLSSTHDVIWRTISDHAADAMRSGAADHPLIGAAIIDTLIAGLISCFPTNIDDPLDDRHTGADTAMRRARGFIDDNYALPITTTDIAAAASVSVRTLQLGFQRVFGTTPTAYLRRVRLHAARDTLRTVDPEAVTVAAVARAAGFAHPSRFAAAFRSEFGLYPSQLLRTGTGTRPERDDG